MNCTQCDNRVCRKDQQSCSRESFNKQEVVEFYQNPSTQEMIRNAAELVDNGRAGTLSRLQEVVIFARSMKYHKIGLAYCYGMEKHASLLEEVLTENGFQVTAVSCSVGGIKQSEANSASCIHKVSCNPVGQAMQLNSEKVDLTLVVGICLGHDILLQKTLNMDFTTFVVKDRVHHHNPLLGLKK